MHHLLEIWECVGSKVMSCHCQAVAWFVSDGIHHENVRCLEVFVTRRNQQPLEPGTCI